MPVKGEKKMTDETTPDVKTFDLAAALAGRTYPEIIVPVFLDEAMQFELSRLDKALSTATTEEAVKLEKERSELLSAFKEFALKVKVKGAPRHLRKATLDKVLADFPTERDALGRVKPNPEGDEAFATATWLLHVVEIAAPDGSVLIPTEEDIINFRNNAPDAAIFAVETAISELTSGSKSGYEAAVQDLDFLSQP